MIAFGQLSSSTIACFHSRPFGRSMPITGVYAISRHGGYSLVLPGSDIVKGDTSLCPPVNYVLSGVSRGKRGGGGAVVFTPLSSFLALAEIESAV